MPNYLRNYVMAAGVMSVLTLLLLALLEWILPTELAGLSGIDIGFATIGAVAIIAFISCIWIKNVMLLAAMALVLTMGVGFAMDDFGLTLLTSLIMGFMVWLLALGVQRRYQDDGRPMPSLWVVTPSLLGAFSGVILLPFLLETGRTAFEAASYSFACTFLWLLFSSPAVWHRDAAA